MKNVKIVFATASPQRKWLCRMAGIEAEFVKSNVREKKKGDSPEKLAVQNAILKARKLAAKHQNCLIIGADTLVWIGNRTIGKPKNSLDAKRMLLNLSGKWHHVVTGVAILFKERGCAFASITKVKFRKISDLELEKYIKGREWASKAGAYAFQGLGKGFVENVIGDKDNVIGLPVKKLKTALKKFGICNALGAYATEQIRYKKDMAGDSRI